MTARNDAALEHELIIARGLSSLLTDTVEQACTERASYLERTAACALAEQVDAAVARLWEAYHGDEMAEGEAER